MCIVYELVTNKAFWICLSFSNMLYVLTNNYWNKYGSFYIAKQTCVGFFWQRHPLKVH